MSLKYATGYFIHSQQDLIQAKSKQVNCPMIWQVSSKILQKNPGILDSKPLILTYIPAFLLDEI